MKKLSPFKRRKIIHVKFELEEYFITYLKRTATEVMCPLLVVFFFLLFCRPLYIKKTCFSLSMFPVEKQSWLFPIFKMDESFERKDEVSHWTSYNTLRLMIWLTKFEIIIFNIHNLTIEIRNLCTFDADICRGHNISECETYSSWYLILGPVVYPGYHFGGWVQ